MCSNLEDGVNQLTTKPDLKLFRKCLKCDQNSVVVTRINDALCQPCFLEYFVHKFRATIGKSKIFEKDEIVLFPYSASGSSVAMLHLINKGVSEEAKKKFTFKTICLYIEDTLVFESNYDQNERINFIKSIKNSVEYSGFKFYYSLFENCFCEQDDTILFDDIDSLNFNSERREKFLNLVNSCKNQTSKEELLKRMKLQIINRVAKDLNILKIIFPTSCTKLTVDMLTNVALGKGAHLSTEMSLEERHTSGQIYVRPLRELTSKEIAFYNHYNGLDDKILAKSSSLQNTPNSTIYRLTEKFINHLQNDFPTTVPTIFRTSEKLTPTEELSKERPCALCELPIDTSRNILATSSAINDLQFSMSIARIEETQKDRKFLIENVCYSCSVVLNDLNNEVLLPNNLQKKLSDMREQIKEFLIED